MFGSWKYGVLGTQMCGTAIDGQLAILLPKSGLETVDRLQQHQNIKCNMPAACTEGACRGTLLAACNSATEPPTGRCMCTPGPCTSCRQCGPCDKGPPGAESPEKLEQLIMDKACHLGISLPCTAGGTPRSSVPLVAAGPPKAGWRESCNRAGCPCRSHAGCTQQPWSAR